MASSWIKVEVITPDKPEIFQIAEILNIDPDAVLGKLVRIWAWADQQTIDGNAGSVTQARSFIINSVYILPRRLHILKPSGVVVQATIRISVKIYRSRTMTELSIPTPDGRLTRSDT